MKTLVSLTVACLMFFSQALHAQSKVAVVSVDEIFTAMPDTYKADSLLAIFQKGLSDAYQDQQKDLNDAYAKFVADTPKMSKSLIEIKRKDLQDRITTLSSKEQEFNKALETEKERLLKPVREKLMKAIQEVAKENGYTHVAYKDQMLVFPPADDITDKVKKKLGIK